MNMTSAEDTIKSNIDTPHVQIQTDTITFSYNTTCEPSADYCLHCHNFYEIYYFVAGDVDYLVEGHRYHPTPHSLLLLAPNNFHGVRINSDAPYCRYSFHFHAEALSPERRQLLLSIFSLVGQTDRQIYFEQPETLGVTSFFESICSCAEQPAETQKTLLPLMTEALLGKLLMLHDTESAFAQSAVTSDTISQVLVYLNQHLSEPITLDLLTNHFYISKHHLNKVFRKATGTTVGDYLQHKRVTYAQQLLFGGHSAADAAAQAGFRDYSSFFRAYRQITGHTPLQDREGKKTPCHSNVPDPA